MLRNRDLKRRWDFVERMSYRKSTIHPIFGNRFLFSNVSVDVIIKLFETHYCFFFLLFVWRMFLLYILQKLNQHIYSVKNNNKLKTIIVNLYADANIICFGSCRLYSGSRYFRDNCEGNKQETFGAIVKFRELQGVP